MMTRRNPAKEALHVGRYATLEDFFSEHCVKTQFYTIDAAKRTTIVGEGGTRLVFSPFSLATQLDQPVEGEVEIFLEEIFHKRDMLLCNCMATSENRLLECGGYILLEAYQNGERLVLKTPIEVEMPVQSSLFNPLAVKLFKETHSTMVPFSREKILDWQEDKDQLVSIKKAGNKKFFQFTIPNFNRIGCYYFYSQKKVQGAMLSARCLPPTQEWDDQAAFLVFKNINAVARMYQNGTRFTAINIPFNLSATIVFIGLQQGEMYLCTHSIEETHSQLITLQAERMHKDQLLNVLLNL